MDLTLPQPPPNVPMPPPSDHALRSKNWRDGIIAVGVLSILALISLPTMTRPSKGGLKQMDAISNLRQIGLALFEFESAFGRMPDDSTIAQVEAAYPGTGIPMGTKSANDYFRQLIVAELTSSEAMFYAKSPDTKNPDNVMTGKLAIGEGECGFAYIPGASSKLKPANPVVIYPLVKGKLIFDTKISKKHLKGNAAIIWSDNSQTEVPVDDSGHAILNGKDIFDPSQPFWHGKTPDVKWPE